MAQQQHPIPPPELVEQWFDACVLEGAITYDEFKFAALAARWGADQELEACCEWLINKLTFREDGIRFADQLRAARRPKSQSLKEQSIALLDLIQRNQEAWQLEDLDVVRRALESIPDPS